MTIAAPLRPLARPIGEFRLLGGNPRRGDVAACKRSLRRFGQRKPIVVRDDGTVEAGNTTLKAALELGWTEIAAVAFGDDDATAKAFALADNRTSELGTFDLAALAAMAADVHAADPELLEAASYTEADLNALLAGQQVPEKRTDPDEVPDPPAEPVTAAGDVWLLGPHRLLCGDSTEAETIGRLMGGAVADMIWTDPPYNVAVTGGTRDPRDEKNHGKGPRIANDAMGGRAFRVFLTAAFSAMAAYLKPGGAAYACHADREGLNFRAAFGEGGLELHEVLIWVKQQFIFGRFDYHWQHESILYGWKPGAAHAFYGARTQSTIWNIDRPMRSAKEHPTQKPVEPGHGRIAELEPAGRTGAGPVRRDGFYLARRARLRPPGVPRGTRPALLRRDLPPLPGARRREAGPRVDGAAA